MGKVTHEQPLEEKAVLQKLREARKPAIAAATARMKEQKQAIKSIKEALHEGGSTVPEIAQATGLPSSVVLWYIATMKKYGEVIEGEAVGSYFRYRLVENDAAKAEATSDA
jgi:predicted transcriptional regulator